MPDNPTSPYLSVEERRSPKYTYSSHPRVTPLLTHCTAMDKREAALIVERDRLREALSQTRSEINRIHRYVDLGDRISAMSVIGLAALVVDQALWKGNPAEALATTAPATGLSTPEPMGEATPAAESK